MATIIAPPNDPGFYYHISEASYLVKSHAQEYLDEVFGSGVIRVLDQVGVKQNCFWKRISGTWKLTLFEDTRIGERCIGFEGTDSFRNGIGDILHHIADPNSLLKKMGKVADRWAKDCNVWSFAGHSEGGFFATHVKPSWDVSRVTFNAHKAERGLKNLNLRLPKDVVSGMFSVEGRYKSVDFAGSGHALKGFKGIENLTWEDIDPKYHPSQIQCQLQPEPQLQQQPEPQLQQQPEPQLQQQPEPQLQQQPEPQLQQQPEPQLQQQPEPQPQSLSQAHSQIKPERITKNNYDTLVTVVFVGAVASGAVAGYKVVSKACDVYELESKDKELTKTYATVGGTLGVLGTTAFVVSGGTTTGLSVASLAAGTVALGGGSVVAGACAAFALPAVAAIGAGWIGHQVYRHYHN